MTPKNKVLKILDKYRDMSLTMGCRAEINNTCYLIQEWTSNDGSYYVISTNEIDSPKWVRVPETNKVKILGHPATPLTLLKALGEEYVNEPWEMALRADGKFMRDWGEGRHKVVSFSVPDVTTLSEIPEEDKMWQTVLDVLI